MAVTKFEEMAREIISFCKEHELWEDCIVYFNGKAWSTFSEWAGAKGRQVEEGVFEYEDKNPCDYFEYGNPETLSMSFEGPLYDVLNCYVGGWTVIEEAFSAIFEKHGCYYEMGHAWNLSACEN